MSEGEFAQGARALERLSSYGPMSTEELAERFEVSRDVLLVLANENLVEQVIAHDGREFWYLVRPR
jgi:hypothetical protein